jgi:hypothetical protein
MEEMLTPTHLFHGGIDAAQHRDDGNGENKWSLPHEGLEQEPHGYG